MFIQKKALYNLILLNLNRYDDKLNPQSDLQKWQTENYREKTTEELLNRLQGLNVKLDIGDFEAYSRNFETPEDMTIPLATGKDPLEQDHVFLVLFELWRRLFPERRTLSIFCDELDYLIMNYDLGKKVDAEEMQDTLAYLQQILNENLDRGNDPHQSFELIQKHSANDIESFLFDYILDEIEAENYSYATELLDGFYRYVKEVEWFNYLKARAEILKEPEEGYEHLEALIQSLDSYANLDLIKEMLFFLANSGNHSLFYALAKKGVPFLKHEEDFRDFLEICYSHYDYLELKKIAKEIAEIFHKRSHLSLSDPLDSEDHDLKKLVHILDQKLAFASEG